MIEDVFGVEPASWDRDGAALRAIREQVFVVEQGVPIADEVDALDALAVHVLARDRAGQPIGTGRLVPAAADDRSATASIGRMAVLAKWRGRGVGAAILRVLLEQARTRGWPAIALHAQSHALGFYAGFGFVAHGEAFDECGIAHRSMRLELPPLPARETPPLAERPPAAIWRVDDHEQALAAVITLLQDTRHEIALYTRDLDAALLDVPAALDELKRIALSGRRARLRILIHDARKPLVDQHRLIALAQRLPSAIELRTPLDPHDLQYPSAFLLNDRGGYLFRVLGHRFEGEAGQHAPARVAQLREHFDRVWERSTPSTELRVLGF